MRKIISLTFLTFLLFGVVGCSAIQTVPHDLESLLNDFQWSISEACSQEYLPQPVCTYGYDALLLARGVISSDIHASEIAVRKSLIDSENLLVADSRLRPYFDVLIALLPQT
jgi:hypothetical protein